MNVICSHCGQEYDLPEDCIGKTYKCTICNNDFIAQNPNLIQCPDCGHLISKNAKKCLHCGSSLEKTIPEQILLSVHQSYWYHCIAIVLSLLGIFGSIASLIEGVTGVKVNSTPPESDVMTLIIWGIIFLIAIFKSKSRLLQITNYRLIFKRGIIFKEQFEIWMKDIRGVKQEKTLSDLMIGTKTVSIGTSAISKEEFKMHGLRNAQYVIDKINELR